MLHGGRLLKAAVATLRHEWAEGYRQLQAAAGDRKQYERLLDQTEAVTDELRRRVGGNFTLDELAGAYRSADTWGREAVAEHARFPGWPRTLAVVIAAAFHVFSRGAVDYEP